MSTRIAIMLTLSASAPLAAASITSQVALPVPEDEWIVRGLALHRRASDDPSPMDRELRVSGAVSVVGYGVSGKVDLFAALPVLHKELERDTPLGRHERSDTGIGDLRLWSRVTLWTDDRQAETRRIAGIVGLEVPTGDHDERDGLGRLPRPLQLGSGSWDPFAGAVFTWQRLAGELDVSTTYQRFTEHDGFRFGDLWRLDAAYYHRVYPRELRGGVPSFLYLGVESNLSWQDRNEIDDRDDTDSGGTSWFISPGVQYVTQRWVAEAAVQIPLVQDLHGDALETDVVLLAGIRMNF